jgi:hypothetical protein
MRFVIIFVLTPNLDMYPLKLRFEIARISLRNGAVAQCSQIHHTHGHAYYNIIIIIIIIIRRVYYWRIRSEKRFTPTDVIIIIDFDPTGTELCWFYIYDWRFFIVCNRKTYYIIIIVCLILISRTN